MKKMPFIVSVVGWSGTGKTTFIESAIKECVRRGIPSAAIKISRHKADLPAETKDSARFRAAGASPSIYLGESEMVIISAQPASIDAAAIERLCPGAAIIFCEGLVVAGSLLVLVAGTETAEEALKRPLASVDILIARSPALIRMAKAKNIPAFAPEEVGRFIDYLVS